MSPSLCRCVGIMRLMCRHVCFTRRNALLFAFAWSNLVVCLRLALGVDPALNGICCLGSIMLKIYTHTQNTCISAAWQNIRLGKRKKVWISCYIRSISNRWTMFYTRVTNGRYNKRAIKCTDREGKRKKNSRIWVCVTCWETHFPSHFLLMPFKFVYHRIERFFFVSILGGKGRETT